MIHTTCTHRNYPRDWTHSSSAPNDISKTACLHGRKSKQHMTPRISLQQYERWLPLTCPLALSFTSISATTLRYSTLWHKMPYSSISMGIWIQFRHGVTGRRKYSSSSLISTYSLHFSRALLQFKTHLDRKNSQRRRWIEIQPASLLNQKTDAYRCTHVKSQRIYRLWIASSIEFVL